MALQTKKNGLDVDLISQTIYLPIGTNNQQSFSSLLRSHHMRILLQHSFRTRQHSVKDWSDKLPDQRIRQASQWSCFRVQTAVSPSLLQKKRQQFHLRRRIVKRHKSKGTKISQVGHHKHHGRVVAALQVYLCCMQCRGYWNEVRQPAWVKSLNFIMMIYPHMIDKAWHSHHLMNRIKRDKKKEKIWGVYNSYRRKSI